MTEWETDLQQQKAVLRQGFKKHTRLLLLGNSSQPLLT